ncbi:MAG: hypothetical protein Tsb0021_06970 [Chlamydiales bacterium]
MIFKKFKAFYNFFFIFFIASFSTFASESEVKVAVVHFQPAFNEVEANIATLLQLAEETGKNGAKIVVFPELACHYRIFIFQ